MFGLSLRPLFFNFQSGPAQGAIENHVANQNQQTNPFIDAQNVVVGQHICPIQGAVAVVHRKSR